MKKNTVIRRRLFVVLMIAFLPQLINAAPKPKTYALVVGITTYADPVYNNLQYPASDALRFAEYLKHSRGEDLKADQLQLLLNEQATISAVLRGLNWLQTVCKAKDTAIIFFAGHGALETLAFENEGYLLAFNTPRYHYKGLAIPIKELNAMANTLSVKHKAKVVLVTDACHSGKLAGNFLEHKPLVAEALSQVLNNEVRLAACQPNELAKEGEVWKGGVFTFHLLNGLYGEADGDKDGRVQYNELANYLGNMVPNDPQLKLHNDLQHPALDGPPKFVLGEVKPFVKPVTTPQSDVPEEFLKTFGTAQMSPLRYFFFKIREYPFETKLASSDVSSLAPEQWGSSILEGLLQSSPIVVKDRALFSRDSLTMLWKQLQSSNPLSREFSEKLIDWVYERGVRMIDGYLAGDLDELERREYYDAGSRTYEELIQVQQKMLSVMNDMHPLFPTMQLHHQYLRGLIARLNMAIYRQTDSLMQVAFTCQYNAQQLDDKTGYINNELGNLHLLARRVDSARYYFTMATQLAPAWAIPWSNLISCYTLSNKTDSASIAANIADSLQPNLSFVFTKKAIAFENEGNPFMAAENYYRAIDNNKIHFLPYEKLAHLWLRQQDIATADYYYYEAAQRKKRFLVNETSFTVKEQVAKFMYEFGGVMAVPPKPRCYEGTANREMMVFSYLDSAQMAAYHNQTEVAIRLYEQAVAINGSLPYVHHHLGILYRKKDLYAKAIEAFKQSIANYLPVNQLPDYINKRYGKDGKGFFDCFESELLQALGDYPAVNDHYLLADSYEKNYMPDAAIAIYTKLMDEEKARDKEWAAAWGLRSKSGDNGTKRKALYAINSKEADQLLFQPHAQIAFLKIMQLHEWTGKFKEAEAVLLDQVHFQQECGWVRDTALHTMLNEMAAENGISLDSMIELSATSGYYADIAYNYYWLSATYVSQLAALDFYNRMIRQFPREPHWQEQGGLWLWQRLKLAFNRLHPSQFAAFTDSIASFEFPWYTVEISEKRGADIAIPGIHENIRLEPAQINPLKLAMQWLTNSWVLYKNNNPKPAVAAAIVDLLVWQNKIDSAITWIELAETRNAVSASQRIGLVTTLLYNRRIAEAWEQLNLLDDWGTLPRYNVQSLHKLSLLKRDVDMAEKLGNLNDASLTLHPVQRGLAESKRLWLKGNQSAAFQLLKNSLAVSSEKHITADDNFGKLNMDSLLSVAHYILARMSMVMGDDTFAQHAITEALDHGYVGYYVLSYDPLFMHWRDRTFWMDFIKKTRKIDYAANLFNEFADHKPLPHINGVIDFRNIKIPSRFR